MNTMLPKQFVVPGFTDPMTLHSLRLPKHVEVYLVGGAVRDLCMGLPAKDRDWVVVGASPQDMTQAGFTPVGAEFPVFLHPDTKEEYALARTERKAGVGYKGFIFFADPSVTLTQDLTRRDLTINAMAINAQGQLIDPLGGFNDVQHKVLRHVGPAFLEDPLRVLRLARFAARFESYRIHSETLDLCRRMSLSGELAHLVPERIQAELSKGFAEKAPARMWLLLSDVDAWHAMLHKHLASDHLQEVLNVFKAVSGHCLDALQAADAEVSVLWRWCCVLDGASHKALQALAKAWRLPAETLACALVWAKTNALLADAAWNPLDRRTQLQQLAMYLQTVDVYRRPERLQCILQGLNKLTNMHNNVHNQDVFDIIQSACVSVLTGTYKRFIADGLQGGDVSPVPAKVAMLRTAWLSKL